MTAPLPGLKQFLRDGCLSYLFFDRSSGEALLVDPGVELIEDYRSFTAENSLKPCLIVDTRVHWHHLSASHLCSGLFGAPVAMSAETRCQRVSRRLADGERLRVGGCELETLLTPGVSPDALCLAGGGCLFTGDTLVPGGGGGRLDLPGSDAGLLWRSLRERLGRLPGGLALLPGCAPRELVFSTLETERKSNPDLLASGAEALLAARQEESPGRAGDARFRLEYNLSAAPSAGAEGHFGAGVAAASGGAAGVATISVEKCAQKLKAPHAGTAYLDVREPGEFSAGHVPGSVNIPLSELPLRLSELAPFRRIYVSCQSGRRSRLAALALDHLGYADVVDVSGGFKAWENAGLPVA